MRRIIVVVALIVATLCSTVALADEAPPQAPPPAVKATVVKLIVKRPPRTVYRRARLHLQPHGSVAYVLHAINREAAMWGVSAAALRNRAYCESKWRWWATNGQYIGVLQMGANAFYRGVASIRTRKVVEVSVSKRRMHSRVYRHWSDGKITRSRGRVRRQTVVTTRHATLPKQPSMSNVDVQLRIGAQALRGISAVHSSEWSCGA